MGNKLTTKEYVEKAIKVHGEKYDYSNLIYYNQKIKVKFKCLIHNHDIEMLPSNHLQGKVGCKKCADQSRYNKVAKTTEQFIKESSILHNNFYDYSKVEYINARKKVTIICPIHGEFQQTPDIHLRPCGCSKCKHEKLGRHNALTKEEFINRANKLQNNKYDYSLVDYINEDTSIVVICPIHGKFSQKPYNHLNSNGCKKCGNLNTSKYQKENPNGWGVSTWIEKAKKSKFFDSFKFYLIECWNENEKFYKIGRTYTKVKYRFRYKTQLPYRYKILKEIIGTAEEIVKLELNMKKLNKQYKYTPKSHFCGQHECYYKINTIDAEYI